MNKMLALWVVAAACIAWAGAASGEPDTQATLRMSWGTCEPQLADVLFILPTTYTLVLSAAGLTPGPAADDHTGTDVGLVVEPLAGSAFPDAWRFDAAGCQTGAAVSLSNAELDPGCPTLKGTAPVAITYVGPYDETAGSLAIRLATTYDVRSPAAGQRYTLWQVTFDMTKAMAGPGTAGETCGGADGRLRIRLAFADLFTARGVAAAFLTAPGDLADATWNGALVPTVTTGWGRLKGLYR